MEAHTQKVGGAIYTGRSNLEAMALARRYNGFLLSLVTRYCPAEVRGVVDFGAGTGTFAKAMRAQHYSVVPVEMDPSLQATLKADGFASVASLTQLPAQAEYIYSLNVLEHIKEDKQVLRQLAAALKPGGKLMLYVPAFPVLYSKMDQEVGHHRRYTRADLHKKLQAAGFSVDTIRYVDSLGFLAALTYKTLRRSGTLQPGQVKTYDTYVFPVSLGLDRLTQYWFGKNILAVATKK
ncbi:MAG: class I SAM-dependent methyltransferase [Candidatus Andersenbacteria bacterium]